MTEVEEEIETLINCFQYAHLLAPQQEVSSPFYALAMSLKASPLMRNLFQLRDCLKSLLVAKDCAVRATL